METDVLLTRFVRILFSHQVQVGTVTNDTFFLTDSQGAQVPSSVIVDKALLNADLRPLNLLLPDETYTVHVIMGVTDILGNPIAAPFTSTFTTRPPCVAMGSCYH
jgi:hypothetical protein